MGDMNIRVSQMEGKVPVTVMHISGEVDASSHQQLDSKAEELTSGGASHILLDLSETRYMSSAGFRSMHKIYTALLNSGVNGAALKLLNPSDEVKRLMKAMGFDAYLSVHNDMNEAVNAF